MVIIGHKPDAVEETLTALCAAVEDGRLSPEELDAKVTRILRLKQAYGLLG
jgi:beta-glucosidase-like glycosyl hydrolase